MRTNLFLVTLLLANLGGCDSGGGDEGDSTSTTPMTSNGPTTPTGETGDTPTTGTPGETGAEESTGGGGGELVNGCDSATATDMTAMADVTITQEGLMYTPKCVKVTAGTNVKFVSAFASHPLVGGAVADGAKVPDGTSPITPTSTGTEATFTLANAGTFPYYCDLHALSGMTGAIFVE